MEISPSLLNHFHSDNFKWPYHATTIKVLLRTNRPIVKTAFTICIKNYEQRPGFLLPGPIIYSDWKLHKKRTLETEGRTFLLAYGSYPIRTF